MSSSAVTLHGAWESAPRPRRRPLRLTWGTFAAVLALHAVLALLLRAAPMLSAVHALGTVAVGLLVAVSPRPERVLYVAAYIAGSEVLWRMTQAPIFWETGKYAVILILAVFLLRTGLRGPAVWPLAYLVLLVPSCFLTVSALGFGGAARDAISFNLSGPVSLAVALMAFASVDLHEIRLSRLMMGLLWPIAGVASIAAYSTLTATTIRFSTESNFTTSGGYGPNQVSAILSIGALACVLLALLDARRHTAFVFYGLGAALLFQAVLTFSRGGVYAVLLCMALLMVHYLWRPQIGMPYLVAVVLVTLVGGTLLLPRLNSWTGGTLAERYASLDATHRTEIASEDLELFREHPVAGVGVGMAKMRRKNARYAGVAPHTEFSRVIAEHGSLGAMALLVLAGLTATRYVTAPSLTAKGWVAALTAWCLATMSVSAMRLVVIGILFGIAYLPWQEMRPRGDDT